MGDSIPPIAVSLQDRIMDLKMAAIAAKPNDRTEKDRAYAVLLTDIEKLQAYAVFNGL